MMKKTIALLLVVLAVYWSFIALMPNKISTTNTEKTKFSTERALKPLAEISKSPHYTANKAHKEVRDYIVKELENLGLEVELQKGYSLSRWGNLTKPVNIISRIKGQERGKALMLLSHYDSNPHSSLGSSDAGSGVVTILEGIRAFLEDGKTPKNDIIILITDAEELGLNGADLFVNKHAWARDVGLVLNFEARGSGGPSYMLIETNGGNANLIKAFAKANPDYPVANSLVYSIYKMLPNDTDLTVFGRDGNINGFNFAFIDDHYDYHTAMDNFDRLDRNSLEHQGSYLMPLLNYFSETNLNNLNSNDDYVYFNVPIFKLVNYPFSWIFPMLILAFLIFIILIFYGKRTKVLHLREIAKGFLVLLVVLSTSGLVGYFGWQLMLIVYPKYNEILQGFTYNGYTYIWMFLWLTLAICFYGYHKVYKVKNRSSLLVAPLFLWLVICTFLAIKLKGGSFFIVPVYFALLSLYLMIKYGKGELKLSLVTLLSFPVLLIFSPLIKMFPVGLGLKTLYISTMFIVLVFSLLIPIFGTFKHKNRWSYIFLLFAFISFIKAHFNSDFKLDRPKPNSLIYVMDEDTQTAKWATYDCVLDEWTQNFLGNEPDVVSKDNKFGSKYGTGFSYTKSAPIKDLETPLVHVYDDTIIGNDRHFKISVMPHRPVDRIELFADSSNVFTSFSVNSVEAYKADGDSLVFTKRRGNRLFAYFVVDNESLEMSITVPKNQKTKFELYEASFDLLKNSQFSIPERKRNMIPKPFVLNDAVVVKKAIVID